MGKFWQIIVLVLAICAGAFGISNAVMARSTTLTEEELQMYSQNNIIFYEPCTDTKTEICGTNQNYAGETVFTDEQMRALEANSPFYQNAGNEYDIPWQVIAVVHMRENGLARGNPNNGQGVYQFRSEETRAACTGGDFTPGEISDDQFQIQTNCAAKFLKGKANGLDLSTDDGIKKLFFRYNGTAGVYIDQALALGFSQEEAENGEGSPYVMNRYDEKREPSDTWGQIKEDEGSIEYPANSDFGAFVYYKAITCDGSSSSSDGGSSSSSPSCNSCEQGSLNINGAGACLAWPLKTEKAKYTKTRGGSPTPAFEAAFGNDKYFTDYMKHPFCSGFTAAVVRYSGYDENFTYNMPGQLSYARKHSDKWETIEWDGNKSSLQGGDIMVHESNPDHSWMIVEDESGVLYVAEGSKTLWTFGHITDYHTYSKNGTYIIRAKNARNSNVGVNVEEENGVTSSSSTGTLESSGRGNRDIGASAVELAWPYSDFTGSKNYIKGPTDKFKEFYETLSGRDGDSSAKGGKSCDYFLHTVLVYSGLESNDSFPWGDVGDIRDHLVKSDNWEEVNMADNRKLDEYQDGDVVIYFNGDTAEHVAILVEIDGKKYTAQASHGDYYGVIKGTGNITGELKEGDASFESIRVFRNKNNKSGGEECNLCESGDDSDVTLKDGGISLEEAKKLMAIYKGYAGENDLRGNTAVAKQYYINVGCHGNLFLNCPSFVRYFVNRYTTKQWTGRTGNGNTVYKNLANDLGLETGSEPQPYAVFSDDSYSPGHTGVVLAVDSAKGTMLVGQAGCMESYTTKQAYDYIGVEELPITKYHLYTYLGPIMKTGGV